MSQTKKKSIYESLSQNIIGQFLAWIVLVSFYGNSPTNLLVMITMFFVSFCRSYVIRRFFNWIG